MHSLFLILCTLVCSSFTFTTIAPQITRRDLFDTIAGVATSATALIFLNPTSSFALGEETSSPMSLFAEFGTSSTKIEQKSGPTKASQLVPKGENGVDPNLRSNYYYPTAKKRYLPRIKLASDGIPLAAARVGEEDWEGVNRFVNITGSAVLPMRLYSSSLSGGGTNVKVASAKDLEVSSKNFERAQKCFAQTVLKKDRASTSQALEQLSKAMQCYREKAGLLGPEGGGDIPSIDEIRRSACRVQGRTFEKKVTERDSRLKDATIREGYEKIRRKRTGGGGGDGDGDGDGEEGLTKQDLNSILTNRKNNLQEVKEKDLKKFTNRFGLVDEDGFVDFVSRYNVKL